MKPQRYYGQQHGLTTSGEIILPFSLLHTISQSLLFVKIYYQRLYTSLYGISLTCRNIVEKFIRMSIDWIMNKFVGIVVHIQKCTERKFVNDKNNTVRNNLIIVFLLSR